MVTNPAPRDPVLIRSRWSPSNSNLGRAVRNATLQFFTQLKPPLPRLERSTDPRTWNTLQTSIVSFEQVRKAGDGRLKPF
jgi:hypothetical protein